MEEDGLDMDYQHDLYHPWETSTHYVWSRVLPHLWLIVVCTSGSTTTPYYQPLVECFGVVKLLW